MVRTYVRKRTFTTAERVLIHLSTGALRPEERTQEGVAAATRSGRSTLTKWLNRLERRGLVTRQRIRLSSRTFPKYAYRLSEPGWRSATNLRKRLASQVVTVRAPNLEALSVRVSEIPTLGPLRLDLTDAVASVRNGRLDLVRPSRSGRRPARVVWGTALRRVDRFFGRDRELRELDAWWASSARGLLVTGSAGIGKTALLGAWVQSRRVDAPVFGFEARRSTSSAAFLQDLGGFLTVLGKPGLQTQLAQTVPPNVAFVGRILRRDVGRRKVLLILDNADQAPRELGRLVVDLLLKVGDGFQPRVVLLARRPPAWLRRGDRGAAPVLASPLQGLDPDAATTLLRSHDAAIESGAAQDIVRRTRGHPLLLHLAASARTGRGPTAERYIQEELWSALSARERTVLEALSVFRRPADERALQRVARADRRTFDRLEAKNLLERTVGGGYAMHDLVRDFVRARIPAAHGRLYHARAAKVLMRSAESRERWEGVYHLLRAGRPAEAASLLDSEGNTLLDCVAAEDVASLVRGLTLDESDPLTYAVFAEVLGDSLRIRGHIAPALFQYRHAERFAEGAGQPRRIPRLLRKMAFLERCRNRYDKALGHLVEARARLTGTEDSVEMIEVLREMALVEQALGDLGEAARHLNEAVDLATDAPDRAALSRTLLALGSLEAQRGQAEQGLELDLEGLRVAERCGNVTEIAHAHIVVGAALTGEGNAEESLPHYVQGFEAASLLGNLRLMAYATMNRTNALLRLRRYGEAGSTLRLATGYFDMLEEKDTVGFLKSYEGELELGLGHWSRATRAWDEGISLLKRYGSPSDLALVLREVAGFCAKQGRKAESQSYLLAALKVARRLKGSDLAARLTSQLHVQRPLSAESGD